MPRRRLVTRAVGEKAMRSVPAGPRPYQNMATNMTGVKMVTTQKKGMKEMASLA